MGVRIFETATRSVGVFADVFLGSSGFGTDGEIGDGDICAWGGG